MRKSLKDIEQEFQERYRQEKPKKVSEEKSVEEKDSEEKGSEKKRKLPLILDIIFYVAIIVAGVLAMMIRSGGHLVSSNGVNEASGAYYVSALAICVILIIGSFIWRLRISKKA